MNITEKKFQRAVERLKGSSWAFSSMVIRLRLMEKKRTNHGPFMESTRKHSIYPRPLNRGIVMAEFTGF